MSPPCVVFHSAQILKLGLVVSKDEKVPANLGVGSLINPQCVTSQGLFGFHSKIFKNLPHETQ
jgi:hypothetical protein